MFSLMIDSIDVTSLAGFQVLGGISEYVWKEPTVWVMFENMVQGDISGFHDGFGSYYCLEEPTVFFSGGELNQPKMNMILALASKKHIVGTEILGFLVGVTEETSDTGNLM